MKLYFYILNGKKLSPKREGGYCIMCENEKRVEKVVELEKPLRHNHAMRIPNPKFGCEV